MHRWQHDIAQAMKAMKVMMKVRGGGKNTCRGSDETVCIMLIEYALSA